MPDPAKRLFAKFLSCPFGHNQAVKFPPGVLEGCPDGMGSIEP